MIFIQKTTVPSQPVTLQHMTASLNPTVIDKIVNKLKRFQTYALEEAFGSGGCDAVSAFSSAMKFVLAESDLAGGGGFTLAEERPKVLERHMEFLPAESHAHKFNFQQSLQ